MTIIRKNRSVSVLKNLNKMRKGMNENATSFSKLLWKMMFKCGQITAKYKTLSDCPNRESNLRPLT